ncbi:MAG: DUF2000 domain-containing protein [Pseudomonadota bacterium]
MADKPTIIIDNSLPVGLQANICAVLGMTLGHRRPDFIGVELRDAGGLVFPGITNIPIPVLGASADQLSDAFDAGVDLPLRVPFTQAALETKDYDSYARRVSDSDQHDTLGLLLCGPRKAVGRLCGNLPLLR